jgi:hypothetical protein
MTFPVTGTNLLTDPSPGQPDTPPAKAPLRPSTTSRSWLISPGVVAISQPLPAKVLDQGAMAAGLGALAVGGRVVPATGQRGHQIRASAGNPEGAAVEFQEQRLRVHNFMVQLQEAVSEEKRPKGRPEACDVLIWS